METNNENERKANPHVIRFNISDSTWNWNPGGECIYVNNRFFLSKTNMYAHCIGMIEYFLFIY